MLICEGRTTDSAGSVLYFQYVATTCVMRGPPGSLARSGLFRGPVASRSPRGRCKGLRSQDLIASHGCRGRTSPVDQNHSRCLPTWPSGKAPQNDATREIIPAHENPLARSPACSACSLTGGLCSADPTGHAPATRPHLRDATTSRPPEDRSSWLAQERGETPPSPNLRPGPKDDAMRSLASSTPWRGFAGFTGL